MNGERARATARTVLAGSREAAIHAAFPASAAQCAGWAPFARRENSVAAARELAGSTGGYSGVGQICRLVLGRGLVARCRDRGEGRRGAAVGRADRLVGAPV